MDTSINKLVIRTLYINNENAELQLDSFDCRSIPPFIFYTIKHHLISFF
jgi:hypothetical protein